VSVVLRMAGGDGRRWDYPGNAPQPEVMLEEDLTRLLIPLPEGRGEIALARSAEKADYDSYDQALVKTMARLISLRLP
jgi:hypothetical protein